MACRNRCRQTAAGAELFYLDATCPLVSKVHREAERHHRRGRHVVLIGHAGHPEVIGTMGQLPEGAVTLVETLGDVATLRSRPIPQPRLRHADHAVGRRHARDRRGPEGALSRRSSAPHKEDICYATTNRQEAVKASRRASTR